MIIQELNFSAAIVVCCYVAILIRIWFLLHLYRGVKVHLAIIRQLVGIKRNGLTLRNDTLRKKKRAEMALLGELSSVTHLSMELHFGATL